MSIRIKEVDESLLDDEIHLCLPPRDSQQYAAFVSGVEKKGAWLGKRLRELSSVAQIAYSKRQPVAFIEYVSATSAPIPTVEGEKTALSLASTNPNSKAKALEQSLFKLRWTGFANWTLGALKPLSHVIHIGLTVAFT